MHDHDDQRELVERVIARTRDLADAHKTSTAKVETLRRTNERDRQRAAINDTREQLHRRGLALRQELETIRRTNDRTKLRSLSRRLREHHEALSRYWAELEQFHARFGPLAADEPPTADE